MEFAKTIFGLTIILILLTSCSKPNKKFHMDYEQRKEAMLLHMTSKYGEGFVIEAIKDENSMREYLLDYGYATRKDDPYILENTVLIKGKPQEDGSYYIEDNYFQMLIKDDYEKFVTDIVNQYFEDCLVLLVFSPTFGMNNRLNKDTKVTEIYDTVDETYNLSTGTVYVFVPQSIAKNKDLEDITNKIADEFVENTLCINFLLHEVYDGTSDYIREQNDNIFQTSKKVFVFDEYNKEIRYYFSMLSDLRVNKNYYEYKGEK